MPESKYSISGIKNGISILFFTMKGEWNCLIMNCQLIWMSK